MSEHVIKVVPIMLEPHTNSDTLSIVRVDGWTCVVKTESWVGQTKAIYIAPDYVVDTTRPEFAWLNKPGHSTKHRVRVQKLRGVTSYGFLIPAPDDAILGENYLERLQVERYEPELHALSTKGASCQGPNGYWPVYDLDNYYNRTALLTEGEEVVISEKLEGSTGRFVFTHGKMFAGCKEWKMEDPNSLWWQCLEQNPWIKKFCEASPDHMLYGEIYGHLKGFPYGRTSNQVFFRAFDIFYKGQWLNFDEAVWLATLNDDCMTTDETKWVPILYRGPFNIEDTKALSEGQTTVPNVTHIKEGVVLQPVPDKTHPKYGRIKLKIVGSDYLLKS